MDQPLIYDVLQTEGDFYLGNETGQTRINDEGGDNLVTLNKNDKLPDGSSRRKMGKENGLSRPKPKRSKKGKKQKPSYFSYVSTKGTSSIIILNAVGQSH